MDLVVRAQRALIDGGWRAAAVGVTHGTVSSIGPVDATATADADVSLADDEVLIPGVIDAHVHVNEPGRTHWEGFASATAAAAAGGVTTIVDMPLNSIPPTTTVEALDVKRAAAAPQAWVDVGFWGGAVPESLGSLRDMHEAGVFGFKAFLSPSGVDEFPHLSGDQLTAALGEIASLGGLLIVHAEHPQVLDAHANAGGDDYARFVDSRPDEAETAAIDMLIDAMRVTGGRAHILHLSSAAALPLIRAAQAEGLPLTAETCPHYLTFSAEQIPAGATEYKCCPPLRGSANREQLWEALVDGTITYVASDHSPATAELKVDADGDFARAWGGISGLQVMLPAVAGGARERGVPLDRALAWLTSAPADALGLTDRGRIRVGARADLVAFAPDRTWRVSVADLQHRNPVSAYDGHTLTGQVVRTWLRGGQVFPRDGAVGPSGRLLQRAQST